MEKRKRPKTVSGPTIKIATGCGNIYVTPNRDEEGRLVEVFVRLGKAGSCSVAQLEAVTRSISLGLKYEVPVDEYIKEFKGIKCPYSAWEDGYQVLSCADAIAKALEDESRNYKSS